MPRPGLLAVAALLAFNLPAHLLYLGWVPGRAGWWLLWVGLTAAVYPGVRLAARRVVPVLFAGGPAVIALPVVAGGVIAGWWHGELMDVLWLHGGGVRAVLLPVLAAAHATFGGVIAALVVAALIATDPPPPVGPPPLRPPRPWLAIALFALASGLFATWYVGQERTVYAFDAAYYWGRAADLTGQLRSDPVAAAGAFRRSVQRDGYTLLPVLPHAAVMSVAGDHRLAFVLTTAVVYLPLLAVAGTAFVRLASPGREAAWPTALVLGLLPDTWVPVLGGYPDIGGVVLAVGTLVVYLGAPPDRLRAGQLLSLAALLVGMLLFRRWYAFWVAAFGLLVGADAFLAAVAAAWRGQWLVAARCLRPPVVLAVLLPLGLTAVALPGARQMIGGGYADAFTAYKSDLSLAERLTATARLVGPVYVLAAALSVAVLVAAGPARRPVLFVAGMVPVILALFLRVQDLNPHHRYLLLPAVWLLPAAAVARLPRLVLLPLAVVGIGFFIPSVSVVGDRWRWRLLPMAADEVLRPATRTDLAEFRRLGAFLDGRPATESFVVVGSSRVFHGSMVAGLGRSLRVPFTAAGRQLIGPGVDKVDGFPAGVFRADLVLVADPPQIHLLPGEQQTVLLTAAQLLSGTGIGSAFVRLPETFTLDGGVTLRAFVRAEPFTPAARGTLVEALRQAHPNHPYAYTPPADLP